MPEGSEAAADADIARKLTRSRACAEIRHGGTLASNQPNPAWVTGGDNRAGAIRRRRRSPDRT
ncbi:MAG: hypothetical protein ACRDT1_16465, partial [Micromonosporaceae bacterium]